MDDTNLLIGREEEMETALVTLSRTMSGHVGMLFVEGEAGISKTRFVEEVNRTVR
jgi:predicted ATPase